MSVTSDDRPVTPDHEEVEGDDHLPEGRKPLADIPPITRIQPSSPGTPVESTGETLSLVDLAGDTLVYLLARNRYLEEQGREVAIWAKDKLEEMQRRLDDAERRVKDAEQIIEQERSKRSGLEDRIKAAFGVGSEAFTAIQEAKSERETPVLSFDGSPHR